MCTLRKVDDVRVAVYFDMLETQIARFGHECTFPKIGALPFFPILDETKSSAREIKLARKYKPGLTGPKILEKYGIFCYHPCAFKMLHTRGK